MEAPVLWERVAKHVLWKTDKDGKPEGGTGIWGGEYLTKSTYWGVWCGRIMTGYSATIVRFWSTWWMLSSKNCWTWLDTEPKPESPWWTSSYEEEDQLTLKVGGGRKDWVAYKAHTARMLRIRWKKMDLFSLEELCAETVWKTIAWAVNEGEVPVLKALRYVIGWRTTAWWRNMSAWGMKWDRWILLAGSTSGDSITEVSLANGQMGRFGRRLDTEVENESSQQSRSDSSTGIGHPFVTITDQKKRAAFFSGKKENPSRKIELVIRRDNKTIVNWINGKAKQKVPYRAIEIIQIQLMEWLKKSVVLSQKKNDWVVHIFRGDNKEAD